LRGEPSGAFDLNLTCDAVFSTPLYGFLLEVNHMKMAAYKLNEYRIDLDENGLLGWETHYGFGVQRRGMCFIYHDILIIGPCSYEEIGYLKGEFIDRLEKLLPWNKTRHYCFASELLDVVSGRSLDHNFMDWMHSSVSIGCNCESPIRDGDPGAFRLDKHRITVATGGEMTWEACGKMNRVLSGRCNIQSGLLLLGAQEHEEEKASKEEFFKTLDSLPLWDRTRIWSPSPVLRACHPSQQEGNLLATGPQGMGARESGHADEKPPVTYKRQPGSQLRSLWPSRFKASELSWPRSMLPLAFRFGKQSCGLFSKAICWSISLIFFAITGLLLGLRLGLHSLKESLHRIRSSEKHHHK
jgi:hypothetical protein